MTTTSSSAPGAVEDANVKRDRPQPAAAEFGRSAAAPVVLAFTTIAALAGAVLALLPTLGRRRPVGRLAAHPVGDGAGDRAATTDPLAP